MCPLLRGGLLLKRYTYEKNNFVINYTLAQGQIYYLRVMPNLNQFMRFDTAINGTAIPVTSVSIPRQTLFLLHGTTGDIPVTVLPQNATNKQLVWSSSNPEIATVDSNGTVLAAQNQSGQTYITVRSVDGNYKAGIEVGVGTLSGHFCIINRQATSS